MMDDIHILDFSVLQDEQTTPTCNKNDPFTMLRNEADCNHSLARAEEIIIGHVNESEPYKTNEL